MTADLSSVFLASEVLASTGVTRTARAVIEPKMIALAGRMETLLLRGANIPEEDCGDFLPNAKTRFALLPGSSRTRRELLPQRVHVLMITGVHGFRKRPSVQYRIHQAGKAGAVGIMQPGHEHPGLPVGHHGLM